MTKNKAFQVLGINPSASNEEIKTAYAELSKKYHPEEYPKEFQVIYEAYVTLTRGGRRTNRVLVVESSPIEKTVTPDVKESDYIFRNVQKVVEGQMQYDFNFDASIQQANKRVEEQFLFEIQMCIEELESLFALPNCNDVKKFKQFFGREEYKRVFFTPQFLNAMADYIKRVDLRYSVYSYIIKFYEFKNKKLNNLIPEAERLYRFIDNRYSIKNDVYRSIKGSVFLGVISGLVYPMIEWGPQKFIQIFMNKLDSNPQFLISIVPFVIIILVCKWVYKFLCKKNYVHAAMIKTAGVLFFLSLFAYKFEIWAPFFSVEGSGMSEMFSIIMLALSGLGCLSLILAFCFTKLMRKEIIEE